MAPRFGAPGRALVNRLLRKNVINEIIGRQHIAVVQGIKMPANRQLLEVVQAGDALRLGLRARERGQQQAARMAMMAMTTSSSMNVNAPRRAPVRVRFAAPASKRGCPVISIYLADSGFSAPVRFPGEWHPKTVQSKSRSMADRTRW